jgi:hypothetical protein
VVDWSVAHYSCPKEISVWNPVLFSVFSLNIPVGSSLVTLMSQDLGTVALNAKHN